jgi:hypothetical protein
MPHFGTGTPESNEYAALRRDVDMFNRLLENTRAAPVMNAVQSANYMGGGDLFQVVLNSHNAKFAVQMGKLQGQHAAESQALQFCLERNPSLMFHELKPESSANGRWRVTINARRH